jgi:hypothetical protein
MKFWSDGSEIQERCGGNRNGFQDAMNGKSEEFSTIKDLDAGVRLINEEVML